MKNSRKNTFNVLYPIALFNISIMTTLFAAVIMQSCNMDEVIVKDAPPEILLDSETGIYTTKTGRAVTISPEYRNAEGAEYAWNMDGKSVCSEPSYTYTPDRTGSTYITIEIKTKAGSDKEEIRIDALDREIPSISLAGAENGFLIATGSSLHLVPSVKQCSIPVSCRWEAEGKTVSEETEYTFRKEEEGEYGLSFITENEDGSDRLDIKITVCSPDKMPFSWKFDKKTYHFSKGRRILISPAEMSNSDNATFTWKADGENVQESSSPAWICSLDTEGSHHVSVTATVMQEGGKNITVTEELTVNVCPPEGTYFRKRNTSSSADWNRIYEYTPAPGQFINERQTGGFDGTQKTPEAAAEYAEKRLSAGNWVSLGGFGGYIVAGFDHSIENTGDYDLAISGNSFEGSSEPGIVWVMQDENGNGLPDDTWYELKGSETGAAGTIQNYSVTYYRPSAAGMPVQWSDSNGEKGEIDYLSQFHRQDYYYPEWISENSYTLRGTRLEARNYDKSGNGSYWVLPAYEWGYADNFSPVDRLTDDSNSGAAANFNHFRISDAMDFENKPANLQYIDFIKVQTGVNSKSGWLGECSTEVFGFRDYSMENK